MCHLTATGQNQIVNADMDSYREQAAVVFRHYDTGVQRADGVHFNFMARGEAFDNPLFMQDAQEILMGLGKMALLRNLVPRFLISTIMPLSMGLIKFSTLFPIVTPEIYYSIYSVKDSFRRKWLPKAMAVEEALHKLRQYQDEKRIIPKLHWAFIEGENDSVEDVVRICEMVKAYGLQANLAIVRYNPYSERFGKESSEHVIERNKLLMEQHLPGARVKKITRVGTDVAASCGMFVGKNGTL